MNESSKQNNIDDKRVNKKYSKVRFTKDEDMKLKDLVKKYGSNWTRISKMMKNRNVRQCKDRWYNYLSPKINNEPWTQDDEELLVQKYELIGPFWKQISMFFPSRTDVYIKNRWNLRQRHIKKLELAISKELYIENLLGLHSKSFDFQDTKSATHVSTQNSFSIKELIIPSVQNKMNTVQHKQYKKISNFMHSIK